MGNWKVRILGRAEGGKGKVCGVQNEWRETSTKKRVGNSPKTVIGRNTKKGGWRKNPIIASVCSRTEKNITKKGNSTRIRTQEGRRRAKKGMRSGGR